jgi:hypothetical protein
MRKERGCMRRNNPKKKGKKKKGRIRLLTLFLMEHLIWSLVVFLTGT